MRLPPTTEPTLVAALDGLDPHFEEMTAAAEDLIVMSQTPPDRAWPPGVHSAVARLLEHEAEFLPRMHALVGLYEGEARGHVSELQMTGWLLAAAVVLVALAAQLGVLQPAIALLGRRMEQSERQYRLLVDSMSDGLVLLDARGRIRFANPRFREMIVQRATSNRRRLWPGRLRRAASDSSPTVWTRPTAWCGWTSWGRPNRPSGKWSCGYVARTARRCPRLVSARRFPRETGYNSALLLVIATFRRGGRTRIACAVCRNSFRTRRG